MNQNRDLIDIVVGTIDANLNITRDIVENSDILTTVENLIQDYRTKFGIKSRLIGDDDSWEDPADNQLSEDSELEYQIMLLVWEFIQGVIYDTATGEIIREVIANELLGTGLSWDKEDAN